MRLLAVIALGTAWASAQTGLAEMIDPKGLQAEAVDYNGRKALRLSELSGGPGDGGLGILKPEKIQDGAIEVWVAGEPGPGASSGARGLVAAAFRLRPGGPHSQHRQAPWLSSPAS